MGRTEMSKRELGRVQVLARVRSKQLRVVDAATLLRVSYRQAKRLWKRYREEGAAGLKHRGVRPRGVGRPGERAARPGPPGHRRWPGPPLRPKRSALRAP